MFIFNDGSYPSEISLVNLFGQRVSYDQKYSALWKYTETNDTQFPEALITQGSGMKEEGAENANNP